MIVKRDAILFIVFGMGILLAVVMNILYGAVKIPAADVISIFKGEVVENAAWSYIIESRFFRSIVAVFAGGALSVAGLILQVYFRNPLAGPGVLGITSGASLGVAFVVLGGASMSSVLGLFGIIGAGSAGAIAVLFLLLFISRFIKSSVTLLVAGLMFGYFTAALINILYLSASMADTRAFVIWGLGSFEGLNSHELTIFSTGIIFLILCSFFLIKPLNGLVLGQDYSNSLGIHIIRTKFLIILITGVLAAIVTVYCGPIGFIGIAIPQLIRRMTKSKNHAVIIPLAFLGGAFLAILADIVVRLSGNTLPVNTVTALIGAPIIIWVIMNMNKRNAEI